MTEKHAYPRSGTLRAKQSNHINMPAKKSTKKAAAKKSAAKKIPAKTAPAKKAPAKKAAKKAIAKKVAKKSPASKPAPSLEAIAKAAYLNYRRRMELGLPGDNDSDWLEAERTVSEA